MAMFGTYIAYVLAAEQGWPITLSIVVAMLLSALGAAVIERVFIRPFDPGNHLAITIVTLALTVYLYYVIPTLAWFLILGSLAGVIWGFDPKAFPTPFPHGAGDSFTIFGADVRYDRIGTWFVILVVLILVSVLLRKTKIGLAFRSVSTNLESSKLVGISIGRTLQFGWALAAAVGTLAGCMIAPNTYLTPGFMGTVLIYSFAAATLGGLDSLGGAVIGGLLVGLLETRVGGYIPILGSELALASALGVIVIILLVTPSGLFGSKRVERV
jgi:branched-chain amino acid transport system permease protein